MKYLPLLLLVALAGCEVDNSASEIEALEAEILRLEQEAVETIPASPPRFIPANGPT